MHMEVAKHQDRAVRPWTASIALVSLVAGYLVAATPGAQAVTGCPTRNSDYRNTATFSRSSIGTATFYWSVDPTSGHGPCWKLSMTDSTATQADCFEVILDWYTNGAGHYDSRILISCYQGQQRSVSFKETETNATSIQGVPPGGVAADPGLQLLGSCVRSGSMWGARGSCLYKVSAVTYDPVDCNNGHLPCGPPAPGVNSAGDFFVWNTSGTLTCTNDGNTDSDCIW